MTEKNRPLLSIAVGLFALTEVTLGVLLQLTGGTTSRVLSFAVVLLACLFCVLFFERSTAYFATQAALLCTLGADYFLVLSDPQMRLPAMLFFATVQLLYATRLFAEENSPAMRRLHLTLRAALSAAALGVTVAVLGRSTDALALVSVFYYANLLLNTALALIGWKKNPLFAAGLVLFGLCDTVIGLDLLELYLPATGAALDRILHPGFNLAWVFYTPSQALLGISLLPRNRKE